MNFKIDTKLDTALNPSSINTKTENKIDKMEHEFFLKAKFNLFDKTIEGKSEFIFNLLFIISDRSSNPNDILKCSLKICKGIISDIDDLHIQYDEEIIDFIFDDYLYIRSHFEVIMLIVEKMIQDNEDGFTTHELSLFLELVIFKSLYKIRAFFGE